MGHTLNKILIFAAGAAIGSAVTWKFVKTKYERIAQEEIDSVKEVFSKKKNETKQDDIEKLDKLVAETQAKQSNKPMDAYAEKITELGYKDYSSITNNEKGGSDMEDRPYVIMPEEFGELDGYNTVSLTYYADAVLTDDYDNPIEDVDDIVGYESLEHFGEYEDDSVFVRNDRLKTDYEILLDMRKYAHIQKEKPGRVNYHD